MSVKRYTGSAWVDAGVKRYTGTAWVDASSVKRFTGSNWVECYGIPLGELALGTTVKDIHSAYNGLVIKWTLIGTNHYGLNEANLLQASAGVSCKFLSNENLHTPYNYASPYCILRTTLIGFKDGYFSSGLKAALVPVTVYGAATGPTLTAVSNQTIFPLSDVELGLGGIDTHSTAFSFFGSNTSRIYAGGSYWCRGRTERDGSGDGYSYGVSAAGGKIDLPVGQTHAARGLINLPQSTKVLAAPDSDGAYILMI